MNPIRRPPRPLPAPTPPVARLACLVVALACAAASAQDRPPGEVDGVVIAGYDAVVAFPVAGVLREVNVEPGARVAAADQLAKLDDAEARAAAELARLAAEDNSSVELARQRLEIARLNDGRRSGAAAAVRAEDQRAQINLRIAELELQRQESLHQQAQRELELALVRLRQHTLTAPVDAVVERVLASPGSFVDAGQPILRLVQPRKLLVEVQAPSDLAAGLALRGPVNVYPIAARDAAPEPFPGRIVFIAATLNPETDSRLVRIALDGEPNLLPGAHVGVDLTPEPKPASERSEEPDRSP